LYPAAVGSNRLGIYLWRGIPAIFSTRSLAGPRERSGTQANATGVHNLHEEELSAIYTENKGIYSRGDSGETIRIVSRGEPGLFSSLNFDGRVGILESGNV
jgi:hypothetical protein